MHFAELLISLGKYYQYLRDGIDSPAAVKYHQLILVGKLIIFLWLWLFFDFHIK